MTENADIEGMLATSIQKLSDQHAADVYLFSAMVDNEPADKLINMIRFNESDKKNCVLILTTLGGIPDAGYRIVRQIKRYYDRFILYVFGTCKSTGTLMALGADQIIMSDFGEFGPLDIQLTKDDEMLNTSGLSYIQSLVSLNEQMFHAFENNFLDIKNRSQGSITTKTAAEISCNLAIGLIAPISGQIDPVKLGEVYRAMAIAEKYGQRLTNNNQLYHLLMHSFPSHGFVIDIDEAKDLFNNVSKADKEHEIVLEQVLSKVVRYPSDIPQVHNLVQEYVIRLQEQSKSSKNISSTEPKANQNGDLTKRSSQAKAKKS